MGSVLVVEDPLADISKLNGSTTNQFQGIAECMSALRQMDIIENTSANTVALDSLFIAPNYLQMSMGAAMLSQRIHESEIKDVARFASNSLGDYMYGFVSKINHGYPTNVALSNVIVDEEKTSRICVFATKHLSPGEELQYDYFGILCPKRSAPLKLRAKKHRIDIFGSEPFRNESFREMIHALTRAFERQDIEDVMAVLSDIIESGLMTKLKSNGFSPTLLMMLQQQKSGKLEELLRQSISKDVCWEMYSVDACDAYVRSCLGRASPRTFMGDQFRAFIQEMRETNDVS